MAGQPETSGGGRKEEEQLAVDLLYPFYLDADMSMAFAAALTGGVALEEEQIDRSTDTSRAVRAIRGNLRLWRAGGLEAGREATEVSDATSESRLVKRHSDASIFIALYDELRRTGQLRINPAFEDMSVRDLVALELGSAVAPLRRVVDQVIRLLDLNASALGLETGSMEKEAPSDRRRQQNRAARQPADPETAEAIRQLRQLRALFQALSDDLEHSGMIDIVVGRGDLPAAVLTLDKRFVAAPTLELLHTSRFTVVGKVSQMWLDDTEFVNLYRRSVLSLVPALAQTTAWGLLAMLGAMGRGFDLAAMQRSPAEAMGITAQDEHEEGPAATGTSAEDASQRHSEDEHERAGESGEPPEEQPTAEAGGVHQSRSRHRDPSRSIGTGLPNSPSRHLFVTATGPVAILVHLDIRSLARSAAGVCIRGSIFGMDREWQRQDAARRRVPAHGR